jgi:hypothetical protein
MFTFPPGPPGPPPDPPEPPEPPDPASVSHAVSYKLEARRTKRCTDNLLGRTHGCSGLTHLRADASADVGLYPRLRPVTVNTATAY